jgi:hypothetical protein
LDVEVGVVVVELVVDELQDLVRLGGERGERVERVGLGGPAIRSVPVVTPPPEPDGAALGVGSSTPVQAARIAGRPPAMTTVPAERRMKSRLENRSAFVGRSAMPDLQSCVAGGELSAIYRLDHPGR